MPDSSSQASTLADRLRLGTGFHDNERPQVLDRLASLDRRLAHFPADSVDLEISIKEREGAAQKVTLEAWIGGLPHMAARSEAAELTVALGEVRDELLRQIGDAADKRDPRKNKHLRET